MKPNCMLLDNEMVSTLISKTREEGCTLRPDALSLLDKTKMPAHVAIIPDGNRRWAKQHNLGIAQGHDRGADNVMAMVRSAKSFGIKYITFYLFSTENWARDKFEVNALMFLLKRFIIEKRAEMIREGVRLHTIGDLAKLSKKINAAIDETKQATLHSHDINMILALNYGARDELKRAFLKISKDLKNNIIQENDIDEPLISSYLDTAHFPDPDLLIRTSGEHRISNYLLWQLSYSELYVSRVLWPDFTEKHFLEALLSFQSRERRLGGT
jgi:undecaprenyl diphosphate synthase